MNGDQLRMARALLRLGIRELGVMASVSPAAILRIESGRKPHAATVERLRLVLEERGVVFIPALLPFHTEGVALRVGATSAPVEIDDEDEADGATEVPDVQARGWEVADMEISPELIEGMREYWSDRDRWSRLSPSSQKALAKALGETGGQQE